MDISQDTQVELFKHNYDGSVNWMHSKELLSTKWVGNKFSITMKIESESYASWVNAYWARAEARGILTNIKFDA